jgi:hypothetical protein
MSKCVGYSGNEHRLHVGSWDGMGRFTNQKGTAEPPPVVEGRPTLDGSLMKSLGFRTEHKIFRALHHGLRPPEFVFRGSKPIEFMGRMLCGSKVSEGAKVNTDIEHTKSNNLLSFNNLPLVPVTLLSLMEFRIGLGSSGRHSFLFGH